MSRDQELVEALVGQSQPRPDEELPVIVPEPDHNPKKRKKNAPQPGDGGWWPKLGPVAKRAFLCDAKYTLLHGERYSGKTYVAIHRLMRHCVEHDGAVAVIATMLKKGATEGGPWSVLHRYILPEWADGLGIQGDGPGGEFVERRTSEQVRYVWVSTLNGGWSRLTLLGLQHGESIRAKVKTMAYSAIFYDELGETKSNDYFLELIQQLRLRDVPEKLYIAASNPSDEGEESWVYKQWFITENQPKPKDFREIHIPISDNIHADPAEVKAYYDNLRIKARFDPTAGEREMEGKWVRRPKGSGIFRAHYDASRHKRGDAKRKRMLVPRTDWRVIILGIDQGPVNFSVSFLQKPPNKQGKPVYGIFDEVAHIGEGVPYSKVCNDLLRKMNFWCGIMGVPFIFQAIADSAAFNQLNSDGIYDARKIEGLIEAELKDHRDRYPNLDHIAKLKMRPCPKPPFSIEARVNMMRAKLDNDELIVSATAERHVLMFEQLESDPQRGPAYPLKDAQGHIHIFDSCSYPIYYDELGGRQAKPEEEKARTDFVEVG